MERIQSGRGMPDAGRGILGTNSENMSQNKSQQTQNFAVHAEGEMGYLTKKPYSDKRR